MASRSSAKLRPATEADLEVVASWIESPRDCELWAGPALPFPLRRTTLARDIGLSPETSFCLGQGRAEAFGQLLDKGAGRGHLAKIVVAPGMRRSGRGSGLVLALLELAARRGFTVVGLNVQRDNPAAASLYRRLGFRPAERPAALGPAPGAEYLECSLTGSSRKQATPAVDPVEGRRENGAVKACVAAICTTAVPGTPLRTITAAVLEPGRGLVGDRYYLGTGTFSEKLRGKPDAEITLIEAEEIRRFNTAEAAARAPCEFRRNIVTQGLRLNELVGQRFSVGTAVLEGIRLCEPCAHLAKLVSPRVVELMAHRAGLRARIVSGGTIRPGDEIAHTP
jgi:ribosomal protein S18 acetylase RimI-like enzyme